MFLTVEFGSGLNVENALEQYAGYPTGYYEDEDFQSGENSYGYDWVPNYIYYPRMNKRDIHEPVTKACCKKACTIDKLIQYCPKRL